MIRSFIVLVAMALAVVPARAQPLADKVPDDAVIYVAWAGTDDDLRCAPALRQGACHDPDQRDAGGDGKG